MRAFDDVSSIGHLVLGFFAGRAGGELGVITGAGFGLYQLREAEPMPNKLGDFLEFGLGVWLSGVLR